MKKVFFLTLAAVAGMHGMAQAQKGEKTFTHADTLRGTLGAERTWWDVQQYNISVAPDYLNKTIRGTNRIVYKVVEESYPAFMQLDLQQPMELDSVLFGKRRLQFTREGNAFHVQVPKQKYLSVDTITTYFHGQPRIAVRPPWDGGWIFAKDAEKRPWMSVACQGLGASVWYPCKDHQSDEPDNGAILTIAAPDTLVAVGNGRMIHQQTADSVTITSFMVRNPINNYTIIPYIGKYAHFSDTLHGEKGVLDMNFWPLDYNLDKAKKQFAQAKDMMRAFEYWFGPYPFYEDGYQLIESPHLGMEHQSAVAYGNHYQNGYLGRDLSGTGWGTKWDFIIVHESGHEWFANNITTKDIADMWVHEGFTNYSETLFTEYYYGKEAGNDYCYGIRKNIRNDVPIIGHYGVNDEGSGDMYYKGANMLHSIRHAIDNDVLFRQILRGLGKTFYHQTVTTQQVEQYISKQAGFDFSKVFDQYLRTTQIPVLEFAVKDNKLSFRYTNCVKGFNLPLALHSDKAVLKLKPTEEWQSVTLNAGQQSLATAQLIERLYYIHTKATDKP
ncbi:M1 family metallopeptidase [Deminuibacter soli]|uniref:M1 family peptidase n=1 Tax=Deminuibacter soli TaxID=2291815 RepID=A0A3E1NFA9_9BACT|nr:M1 family metallopeptidase [Deminuibacter soli]RFM26484.1 M1 family peptidase [Deminuibacter soli]